jgi:hypothetical protein
MCFWRHKKKAVVEEAPAAESKKDEAKEEKVEEKKDEKPVEEKKETVKPKKTKVIKPEEETKVKKGTKTKKVTPAEKKTTGGKQYIVQKSPANKKKWEVVIKGGTKALKLFDTEAEASEYAKVTAKNQGASTLKRASKGDKKGKFISK